MQNTTHNPQEQPEQNGEAQRSLSRNEARLISKLEFEHVRLVRIKDVQQVLASSYQYSSFLLHSLVRKGWLARLRPGLYELIPASSGGFWTRDWYASLQAFRTPYYLSFLAAAYFHGFSPQRPRLAQVATSDKVRARYAAEEAGVESVTVGPSRFFGFQQVERNGLVVNVAEPAKVIVDCLYSPEKSGGILEVARIVARGARQTSSSKLVDYAIRMDNRALVQRLGYLADTLDVKLAKRARDQLLKYASQDGEHSFLGSTKVFGTKGNYSRTWRITDNVGRERLLGELEF